MKECSIFCTSVRIGAGLTLGACAMLSFLEMIDKIFKILFS